MNPTDKPAPMTAARIQEMRDLVARWDVDIGEHKNHLDECLEEIERLRAALFEVVIGEYPKGECTFADVTLRVFDNDQGDRVAEEVLP